MSQENRVQVAFMGETFTAKGDATREEIRRTEDFLGEQLEILRQRCPNLNQKNLAILVAFNLAHELLRVRRDYEDLASLLDQR